MRKKNNENKLMSVLAFMSLSIGIWSKYRQLWLQEVGYSITGISKILSVSLICSSIIAFFLSLFSHKIKVKNIVVLSLVLRTFSMICLLLVKTSFLIKSCILLGIMCEVIFSIAFYPLLSFESKSNNAYKRKMLIDYVFKDVGIVFCGLMIGVSLGEFVFDYNWCLIISILASLISFLLIMPYKGSEERFKKPDSLKASLKDIFYNKINRTFLCSQVVCYISYGIVFDLMMLILTNYLGFDVTFTSIFIIVSNLFGTIFSFLFSKTSSSYSVALSAVIKYGSRAIFYILAFLMNKNILFIFAIIYAIIMSRVMEDKVTGTFVEMIDEKNQFLYGNLRYFAMSLGEGIGAFLAGVLISNSLRILFLGAGIMTIIQTSVFIYLNKLRKDKKLVDF